MIEIFDAPLLLGLAVVLPVFVGLLLSSAHVRRVARLARLGSADVVRRLLPSGALVPPGRRIMLLCSAALLGGVAIAGPRWGRDESRVSGAGIDIVLALDASLSMTANDERPTRLERMKQEVRRLRASSTGDRIGVIAFAGRSYILTPLTTDEGALDLFLDNLDPSIVGHAGSAVSRAITQGTDLLLASQSASDRALIVMSDWESFDDAQEVLDAAARVRGEGISFIAVGFGTARGSRIPMPPGSRTEYKLDEVGRVVQTAHNAELMRAAANEAGGVMVEATESDKASRVRQALSTLRAQRRSISLGLERTPRFQWFLLPALILVLVDTALTDRLGRMRRLATAALTRRRRRTAAASLAAALIASPQLGTEQPADQLMRGKRYAEAAQEYRRMIRAGDASEKTLYNLGTALLLADSVASAVGVLNGLANTGEDELRYRGLFNRGLAQLNAGLAAGGQQREDVLNATRESYRNALLLRPDDLDAKWNYELALRDDESGGGGGGQQQQQQQQSSDSQQDESPRSDERSALGRDQAEQILNNAARDERDVQARSQERNRPARPPGGKDW